MWKTCECCSESCKWLVHVPSGAEQFASYPGPVAEPFFSPDFFENGSLTHPINGSKQYSVLQHVLPPNSGGPPSPVLLSLVAGDVRGMVYYCIILEEDSLVSPSPLTSENFTRMEAPESPWSFSSTFLLGHHPGYLPRLAHQIQQYSISGVFHEIQR